MRASCFDKISRVPADRNRPLSARCAATSITAVRRRRSTPITLPQPPPPEEVPLMSAIATVETTTITTKTPTTRMPVWSQGLPGVTSESPRDSAVMPTVISDFRRPIDGLRHPTSVIQRTVLDRRRCLSHLSLFISVRRASSGTRCSVAWCRLSLSPPLPPSSSRPSSRLVWRRRRYWSDWAALCSPLSSL